MKTTQRTNTKQKKQEALQFKQKSEHKKVKSKEEEELLQ
jgi:hypothetical protein